MTEFFSLARKSDSTYSLTIVGAIGNFFDDYFFDGNTLDTTIKSKLDSLPDGITDLEVRINSPGGSATAGYSIYNQLKASGKKITTINLGEVSSIASVIFLAGEDRIMPNSSYALIHQPWHSVDQNLKTAKQHIQQLEAVTTSMRDIYKEHINLSYEEIDLMMEEETILTADRALEIGFSTSKTLPFGVSLSNDVSASSDDIFAQRVSLTKAFLKKQTYALLANNNKEDQLMSDKNKHEIDVEALIKEKALIEGKLEASEKMKAQVESDYKAFKDAHKEVDIEAIKAEARKEAIAELKEFESVKVKAEKAGFKSDEVIKAESAEALMRAVVTEFGMNADAFSGVGSIAEMFNYVIKNKPSQDADDDYIALATDNTKEATKEKSKTSSNFWDTLNKKSKGVK